MFARSLFSRSSSLFAPRSIGQCQLDEEDRHVRGQARLPFHPWPPLFRSFIVRCWIALAPCLPYVSLGVSRLPYA